MEGLARVLLGLLVVAVVIQLVKNGWSGVGAWMRAKFLGEVA